MLVLVALLIGLVAGVSLILGPRLYGRDSPANSGSGPPSSPGSGRSSGPESGGGIPAAFDGTWTGTARNQDGVTFPAAVTFRTGRRTAQVTYSGEAHCATTLTLTGSGPGRIEMDLPSAPSCTAGTVTVRTRQDGRLDYAFTSSSGRFTIQATLSRT
jgi:hypothetical protein